MMWRKKLMLSLLFFSFFCVILSTVKAQDIIFSEDFELCIPPDWTIDNGVWECCLHSEPQPWGGGSLYATTVCDGDYPGNTDSQLITSPIDLPGIAGDEEIHLRFWHLFSYDHCGDYGQVRISVWDSAAGVWSSWEPIGSQYGEFSSWSRTGIDLTKYAGERIKIAFFHVATTSYPCGGSALGWNIDNVEIVKIEPTFTGNFETGWFDWSTDKGVWQVGTPEAGPPECRGGTQCAGTVLNANYPGNTDSRLITPSINFPVVIGDEEIHLSFWQWFSYDGCGDVGYVQISVWDEVAEEWSSWISVGNTISHSSSWSKMGVDLTKYAGDRVRIAFLHVATTSYPCGGSSTGWYVDDIQWIKKVPYHTWDFECGWDDWSADRGVWQVGIPTAGPDNCYSGEQCAGTILDGNYLGNTDSRLVSPSVILDDVACETSESINLCFQHWFSYDHCADYGQVQISVWDYTLNEWSSWVNIGDQFAQFSSWTRNCVDLTSYADEKVRIAFFHAATTSYPCGGSNAGWYVDHIRLCDLAHFCECDLNQDGSCNILDWPYFIEDWGRDECGTPPGSGNLPNDCECDLNKDGSCNILEWPRFIEDWGRTDCLICDE